MGKIRFASRINIITGVYSLIDRFNSNNLNQIRSYFFIIIVPNNRNNK